MSCEAADRPLLDKPLHQLTEDDIAQLTREDCRRYLKSKGMRRPSWNKSQAIQQVISLKTLLEGTPSSGVADTSITFKKLYSPPVDNSQRVRCNLFEIKSVKDLGPQRQTYPKHSGTSDEPLSSRTVDPTNMPIGQMTIFYSGKINAYDDVPGDKACAIMQVAASPCHVSTETHCSEFSLPITCPETGKRPLSSSPGGFPTETCNASPDESPEGLTGRKASVQRYLEKKKDRFKGKRNMDVYLDQRMGYEQQQQQPWNGTSTTFSHSMEKDGVQLTMK